MRDNDPEAREKENEHKNEMAVGGSVSTYSKRMRRNIFGVRVL